jgi:hypothetical protein
VENGFDSRRLHQNFVIKSPVKNSYALLKLRLFRSFLILPGAFQIDSYKLIVRELLKYSSECQNDAHMLLPQVLQEPLELRGLSHDFNQSKWDETHLAIMQRFEE